MNKESYSHYKINFSAPINVASAKKLIDTLKGIPDEVKELHLYINSSGGSVPIALEIAKFLDTLSCKLITYNVEHCDSAAVLLFAAGAERVCDFHASFFVHTVSVKLAGEYTLDSIRTNYLKLKSDYDNIISFLSQKTNLSLAQWKSYMTENGHVFSAQEAFDYNLVTCIAENPVKMSYSSAISFL